MIKLLRSLIALFCLLNTASQAQVQSRIEPVQYQFFQGDTLNGFDFDAAYSAARAVNMEIAVR